MLGIILARGWPVRRAWAGVAGLIVLSLVIRITNARHPGFITGDDVEIHELTLSMLFGYQWDIWSLRNAFFPLTFVFPAQAVLSGLGVSAAQTLVFAGRLSVVAWAGTSPSSQPQAANQANATSRTLPARPSRPSSMFTALMTPVSAKTVSGSASRPMPASMPGTSAPSERSAAPSTRQAAATIAANARPPREPREGDAEAVPAPAAENTAE